MIDILLNTNLNVVKANLYFLIIEVIDVDLTMSAATCTCNSIKFFNLKSGKQKHNMQKHRNCLLFIWMTNSWI